MLGIGLLVSAALIIGFPALAAQSQQDPSQDAPDSKLEQRDATAMPLISQDQPAPPETANTPRLLLRSPSFELEGGLSVQTPKTLCDFVCPR